MKRNTHLLMGIASAVPIALSQTLVPAIGCLWFGAAGGALPDYLDLKSDAKRALRHRGASHGVFVNGALAAFVWIVLGAVSKSSVDVLDIRPSWVWPWTVSFALGLASHLLGDACTRAGIRPLLPISRWKLWILPKFLRSRSDGNLNHLARLISFALIAAGIGIALTRV